MNNICENCPLRLFNDKGYNIKGIGNIHYRKMIVLPYIDYNAYKHQNMNMSSLIDIMNNVVLLFTGDKIETSFYITSFIKCKESNRFKIDNSIISKCSNYLFDEIIKHDIKYIMLLGNSAERLFNTKISNLIGKCIKYNNIYWFFNYSPNIYIYDSNKFEIFKSELYKYIDATNNNNFSNYERIKLN